MELTSNIALYFTIIGLSFAAPNARHIRWCTISDLEQQKCNDLKGSCNVPDINLLCVQKHSTDSCMAAIRDGEADAIFLDSGDVYKASRDPYKLKPIIAAPHRSHQELTKCQKEHQEALDTKLKGRFIPQCDEKGNYKSQQCHGSTGHCWCVTAGGEKIEGTNTPPGDTPPNCEQHETTKCQKEHQEASDTKMIGRFIPQCEEKGNYKPQQCHGSTGHCWCVTASGEKIEGTNTPPGQTPPNCEQHELIQCFKERQKALDLKLIGNFIPHCDEKGNYHPKQCHGSTGYCWCVNPTGEKIKGTDTPPGQTPPTCEQQELTKCQKEHQEASDTKMIGRFIPQCDEKGNYHPQQCHGSTGHCWCVTASGEKIEGTNTPPGLTRPTCAHHELTQCLKERQKAQELKLLGNFIPRCDEKGNYHPQQCHGSTGHCWCVNPIGEKIKGTDTPPGQTPHTCEQQGSDKCHYAVAVVKKSSTFQFNQLQGKRSCHSGVSKTAGLIAPINVLVEKKLLSRDGPAKESIEKAASKFFSDSCIPGASESILCHQCKGEGEKKCRCSHDEPYYGDHGALRCLQEDKGVVAFLESSALSDEHSGDYELLCPDNTRMPLNKYHKCNLGKVPGHAVVTRAAGDKNEDINDFLLEAQKKQCALFSSQRGKDLMFHDSTTQLAFLPPEVDTFFFLGVEWYNAMNALSADLQLPFKNKVRWCTINQSEKMKCKDWSDVSGGAIACTDASSPEHCIKLILKGEADAVGLDVQYMYEALKCGLMPAVEEYHNKDDLGPCRTRGSEIKDFGTKYAVALVKKSNKDINWNNLKGKKSCHTGVGDIAGWVLPFGLISQQNDNCDIGSFFAESCAPGSDTNSNLCKLCIGDPKNPMANTKCSLSDKEAYYGEGGAIRCLVEKGDVAFISNNAVFTNTDGKNSAEWAKNLKSEDFELLCLDGSRAPVENYKTCKLSGIPPRAIVTREESVSDVVRVVINQQSLYSRNGFQKDMFQLFSSNKGQNLLFSDATQCLIEFDRQPKDIMEDYFGKSYYNAVHSTSKCAKPSELVSACTLNRC